MKAAMNKAVTNAARHVEGAARVRALRSGSRSPRR